MMGRWREGLPPVTPFTYGEERAMVSSPNDKVGRLAVCHAGQIGLVEEVAYKWKSEPVYHGHNLLDPSRVWSSKDPRWLSVEEQERLRRALGG